MQAIYQTIIYQTVVTKIGQFARDALAENMLITFKQAHLEYNTQLLEAQKK